MNISFNPSLIFKMHLSNYQTGHQIVPHFAEKIEIEYYVEFVKCAFRTQWA